MITALYSRVSTLEQSRDGYSISAQKSRLKAYAKAKGLSNAKHYSDPAFSGGSLDRPQVQQLIKDIKNNRVSTVIVYKLDRLSRSQKDTLTLVQDLFLKHNVNFISLEENIDTSTPMGIAMIGVLSAFAELERSTLKLRTAMGREERAKQGYYHGGGNYHPLGYEYKDGLLHIKDDEISIVKDAFNWYINGCSMNETSRRLREKYPTRVQSKTIVKDVIKNPLYIGKVTFNGKIYDGNHTPLIDEETFQIAQKTRKSRAVGATKTNKRKGLLVGKVYCAQCGARYFREVSGSKKYRYVKYACRSKDYSSANASMIKDKNCQNIKWNETDLDKVVINRLKALTFDNTIKIDKFKQIKLKEKQLNKLYSQLERTKELYVLDLIDVSELKKKTSDLNNQISILKDEIDGLSEDNRIKKTDKLQQFDWENTDKEAQMKLIDEVVDRVEVDNHKVYISLNF